MALYYGDNTELSIALHVQTLPHLKLRSAEVPLKAEGDAHVHCIYRHVRYSYIYTVLTSPAPNRSVVLQHFKLSNVVEIHHGMMFIFTRVCFT